MKAMGRAISSLLVRKQAWTRDIFMEHVAYELGGIVTFFLPSTQNSFRIRGTDQHQSHSHLSWAHASNGTKTACALVSTGSWHIWSPCLAATAVLCPPPDGRNAGRHTARPEMWKHFLFWMQTDSCLSPGVSTKRTGHRPKTNGEEKSKNDTWSKVFRYTMKIRVHIRKF